jgi:hypothetical protein
MSCTFFSVTISLKAAYEEKIYREVEKVEEGSQRRGHEGKIGLAKLRAISVTKGRGRGLLSTS